MAYKHPAIDMKRLFLLGTIMLCAHLCFSQAQQAVLGVNVKNTMKRFNQALSTKGYKPTQTAEGLYEYKIKYAGYPDCRMEVEYNTGNDSIRLVTIFFPHESISKDQAIYNNITKQFKEKYGNEVDWSEGFLGIPNKTHKMKTYGTVKTGICSVSWYFNDEEEDDGVHVQYVTNTNRDSKVSVSSDI